MHKYVPSAIFAKDFEIGFFYFTVSPPTTLPSTTLFRYYSKSLIIGTLITVILAIPGLIKNFKFLDYWDFY